jgi:hypothetical protein
VAERSGRTKGPIMRVFKVDISFNETDRTALYVQATSRIEAMEIASDLGEDDECPEIHSSEYVDLATVPDGEVVYL